MGKTGATDQAMRRVFMVQRRQYTAGIEQLTVNRPAVTLKRVDLLNQ